MKKKTDRARTSTINYYSKNIEKERERKRVDYPNEKYRLNDYSFRSPFCIFLLNTKQHILYKETF